jgi:alpha-tubulin suppressor-like RCC1 family protein
MQRKCLGAPTLALVFLFGCADDGETDPVSASCVVTGECPGHSVEVALGRFHTCAIKDGRLACWGSNDMGQLGAIGIDSNCIDEDLLVACTSTPREVAPGTAWSRITAGDHHSCAIRDDGSLWCWGRQLGNAAVDDVCGADARPCQRTPKQVGTATDWLSVSAGFGFTCGIRAPGTLWCWGSNYGGGLGLGDPSVAHDEPTQVGADEGWSAVSAAGFHTCALRADGSASCFGENDSGQLGNGTLASSFTPVPVAGSWLAIDTGSDVSCGLDAERTLACWGYGACLSGDCSPTPQPFVEGSDWRVIGQGLDAPCAIDGAGHAQCWDDLSLTPDPGEETGVGAWARAGLGVGFHMCMVAEAGQLFCWGENTMGQTGSTPISSGFPASPTEIVLP